ncbi:uncharacterized protein [Dermacentor albipictus]|uniref:uncharacterized protein isoform X2 n=1 Tax=Dermacentor albipictus TaxID=60249 RepID=UPI0038FD1F71
MWVLPDENRRNVGLSIEHTDLPTSSSDAHDLSSMFAGRYCFDEPVDEEKLAALEKSAVTAAGLELVTCRTYCSPCTFPTADVCLDAHVPFFKLDARVPEEKRAAFWKTWRYALKDASNSNTGGISLNYDVLVAYSQKHPAPM